MRREKFDGRSRPTNDTYKENFNRIFNPTLVKNMPNVKWKEIPPLKANCKEAEENFNIYIILANLLIINKHS